jgi:hypothetical protein
MVLPKGCFLYVGQAQKIADANARSRVSAGCLLQFQGTAAAVLVASDTTREGKVVDLFRLASLGFSWSLRRFDDAKLFELSWERRVLCRPEQSKLKLQLPSAYSLRAVQMLDMRPVPRQMLVESRYAAQ